MSRLLSSCEQARLCYAQLMRLTMDGLSLIKHFEGCRLQAYQDGGGIWSLGWGHTQGVKKGDICTQKQADDWLTEDLACVEVLLADCLKDCVVSDTMWDALVSFCYNVGFGRVGVKSGFRTLIGGTPSGVLKRLRAGDYNGAADELTRWDKIKDRPQEGLTRRRMAERAHFLSSPFPTKIEA